MKVFAIIASALVISPINAAADPMRELGNAELRTHVQAGDFLGLSAAGRIVAKSVPGKILDARAFQDGGLYYYVLIQQANGKLVSVVVDGKSGRLLGRDVAKAKAIRQLAKSRKTAGEQRPVVGPAGGSKSASRAGNADAGRSPGSRSGGSGGKSGGASDDKRRSKDTPGGSNDKRSGSGGQSGGAKGKGGGKGGKSGDARSKGK